MTDIEDTSVEEQQTGLRKIKIKAIHYGNKAEPLHTYFLTEKYHAIARHIPDYTELIR